MTAIQSKAILADITKKICRGYHPEKIILFGSFMTGKTHSASDIDLAVIKKTKKSFHTRNSEVRFLLKDSDWPIDVFVFTPEEFSRTQATNPFIREIVDTGKILYAR